MNHVNILAYLESENANEHLFGVNGKIYSINVETNEVTVVDGELKIIREDTSVPDKEYFNNITLLYAVCGICTLYDGIFPGKTGLPHLYDTAVASALHG